MNFTLKRREWDGHRIRGNFGPLVYSLNSVMALVLGNPYGHGIPKPLPSELRIYHREATVMLFMKNFHFLPETFKVIPFFNIISLPP